MDQLAISQVDTLWRESFLRELLHPRRSNSVGLHRNIDLTLSRLNYAFLRKSYSFQTRLRIPTSGDDEIRRVSYSPANHDQEHNH